MLPIPGIYRHYNQVHYQEFNKRRDASEERFNNLKQERGVLGEGEAQWWRCGAPHAAVRAPSPRLPARSLSQQPSPRSERVSTRTGCSDC